MGFIVVAEKKHTVSCRWLTESHMRQDEEFKKAGKGLNLLLSLADQTGSSGLEQVWSIVLKSKHRLEREHYSLCENTATAIIIINK